MIVDKSEILKVFKSIYETQEIIKGMNSSISELKKELAEKLKVKSDVITKAYIQWLLLIQDPTKLQEVDEIVENIK